MSIMTDEKLFHLAALMSCSAHAGYNLDDIPMLHRTLKEKAVQCGVLPEPDTSLLIFKAARDLEIMLHKYDHVPEVRMTVGAILSDLRAVIHSK